MSKRLFLILFALLILVGTAGAIVSAVMFVMAIRFGELGRVIVYFTLTVLCLELVVYSLIRLVNLRKSKKEI